MNKNQSLLFFLCFVLCVIMAAGSMPVQPAKADGPTDVWYGDVNDDGSIDAKDVTMIRRQLAGGWNVNINEEKADLNQDGEINAKDVTMLRRFLAGGWGVELPELIVEEGYVFSDSSNNTNSQDFEAWTSPSKTYLFSTESEYVLVRRISDSTVVYCLDRIPEHRLPYYPKYNPVRS